MRQIVSNMATSSLILIVVLSTKMHFACTEIKAHTYIHIHTIFRSFVLSKSTSNLLICPYESPAALCSPKRTDDERTSCQYGNNVVLFGRITSRNWRSDRESWLSLRSKSLCSNIVYISLTRQLNQCPLRHRWLWLAVYAEAVAAAAAAAASPRSEQQDLPGLCWWEMSKTPVVRLASHPQFLWLG